MKQFILFGLLALSLASLSSCGKMYECDCTPGTSLKVSASDEFDAKGACEAQSNGRCTY